MLSRMIRLQLFCINCGNTGHCTAAMLATGAKGYHFGNKADMIIALRECPSDVWVMGNLDPVGVFRVLTPEDVFARTEELLTCTGEYANFYYIHRLRYSARSTF